MKISNRVNLSDKIKIQKRLFDNKKIVKSELFRFHEFVQQNIPHQIQFTKSKTQ